MLCIVSRESIGALLAGWLSQAVLSKLPAPSSKRFGHLTWSKKSFLFIRRNAPFNNWTKQLWCGSFLSPTTIDHKQASVITESHTSVVITSHMSIVATSHMSTEVRKSRLKQKQALLYQSFNIAAPFIIREVCRTKDRDLGYLDKDEAMSCSTSQRRTGRQSGASTAWDLFGLLPAW